MIRVGEPLPSSQTDPDAIGVMELLAVVEANRTRARTLAGMILTVCGTLVSAVFVILFFIFNSSSAAQHPQAILLLFLSAVISTAAIMASLVSATLQTPVAVANKLALLNETARLLQRENRWVRSAAFLLVAAILVFGWGLVFFGYRVLGNSIRFW